MGSIPSRFKASVRDSLLDTHRDKRRTKSRRIFMITFTRRALATAVVCALAVIAPGARRRLNPAAVAYKLPDQIKWSPPSPAGAQNAVLAGDPSKEGLYVQMVKWLAGNHFSHPHFHPHDRFITVLKGTWWVGTGTKYDPERHRADAGRHLRDPFWPAGAFRRRQRRRRRSAHRRRRAGNVNTRRSQMSRLRSSRGLGGSPALAAAASARRRSRGVGRRA